MLLENLSPRSTVLSPELGRSLTFDREGRLLIYFREGETFKRSLGSEVHLRFRRGSRQRRLLGTEEGLEVLDEAYAVAREARQWASHQLERRLDEEILRWSAAELEAERRRFAAVYKPISISHPISIWRLCCRRPRAVPGTPARSAASIWTGLSPSRSPRSSSDTWPA